MSVEYDFFQSGLWICWRFSGGLHLSRPASEAAKWQWSAHLSSGPSYLQDLAILHGDIKPGNILMKSQNDGQLCAKLGDFGLAMLVPGSRCGKHLYTANYRCPELLSAHSLKVPGIAQQIIFIILLLFVFCMPVLRFFSARVTCSVEIVEPQRPHALLDFAWSACSTSFFPMNCNEFTVRHEMDSYALGWTLYDIFQAEASEASARELLVPEPDMFFTLKVNLIKSRLFEYIHTKICKFVRSGAARKMILACTNGETPRQGLDFVLKNMVKHGA